MQVAEHLIGQVPDSALHHLQKVCPILNGLTNHFKVTGLRWNACQLARHCCRCRAVGQPELQLVQAPGRLFGKVPEGPLHHLHHSRERPDLKASKLQGLP